MSGGCFRRIRQAALNSSVSLLKYRVSLHCCFRSVAVIFMMAVAGLLSVGILSASAHPHIFINAKFDIVVDKQNRVEKLAQRWYFDRLFSASVMLDFDENGNRHLDPDELDTLSGIIKQSLAEFDFFQSVNANGRDIMLDPPDMLTADISDGQLVLNFATRPKTPLVLEPGGNYQFSLYDPSFYVAVNFQKDIDITVNGLPAFCHARVERPDREKIFSQSQADLTEDFFANPGSGLDLAFQLAPKLKVSCEK